MVSSVGIVVRVNRDDHQTADLAKIGLDCAGNLYAADTGIGDIAAMSMDSDAV